MDFSDTRYAVRIVLLSSVVGVITSNMLWLPTLILFDLSTWSMLFVMDAYLFPALFCLVLCAVFVWLAVKSMRA